MQLQDHPFDFPDKGDCCFRNLNYIQNMVGLDGCNILKRILVMMTSGDMGCLWGYSYWVDEN
jgi:hypothetical protein